MLFLEGTPVVSKLNAMRIGASVVEVLTNDEEDGLDAIKAYNATIKLCDEAGDKSTSDLLTKILKVEEGYLDWAEAQHTPIEHLGLANYLAVQTGGEG
ncbi:MAG: ferritin-like domain-containing protein [Thermoanaerobaculales bacterium]